MSKNIIISRTDKIGDLILSIPSFYMTRKMFPDAKITVLVRNYNYDVVKNLEYIDNVIKIDDFGFDQLLEEVRKINPEYFIALYADRVICKLAKKSGAKYRIGPYSKWYSFFSFNMGIFQKRSKSIKNEAEYNLDLIKKINEQLFIDNLEINTKLYYEDEHRIYAEKFIKKYSINNFIIIHAFNGGSAKNLTLDQYIEMAKQIINNTEYTIIFTAAIGDIEDCNYIIKKINSNRAIGFINDGSLLNLAALIDRGEYFIGTSTGPIHIAGALGKKIIGIYPIKKTQSPKRWGVFRNDKVDYILPEGTVEEDYSRKDFLSWNKGHYKELLDLVMKGNVHEFKAD